MTCDRTVFQLFRWTLGLLAGIFWLHWINCVFCQLNFIPFTKKEFLQFLHILSYNTSLFELSFIKQFLLYQACNKVCGLYDDPIFHPCLWSLSQNYGFFSSLMPKNNNVLVWKEIDRIPDIERSLLVYCNSFFGVTLAKYRPWSLNSAWKWLYVLTIKTKMIIVALIWIEG